jgi:hypothetical protein
LIYIERLIERWDELVLRQRVLRAWAEWVQRHRGLDLQVDGGLAAGIR